MKYFIKIEIRDKDISEIIEDYTVDMKRVSYNNYRDAHNNLIIEAEAKDSIAFITLLSSISKIIKVVEEGKNI